MARRSPAGSWTRPGTVPCRTEGQSADDVAKTRDVIIRTGRRVGHRPHRDAVGIGAAGDRRTAAPPCCSPRTWRGATEPLRRTSARPRTAGDRGERRNVAAWAGSATARAATPRLDDHVHRRPGVGAAASSSAASWCVAPTASLPRWGTCSPCRTGTGAAVAGWAASSSYASGSALVRSRGPQLDRNRIAPRRF